MFRLSELIGQYVIGGPRGLWLRDGHHIVNIRQPLMTIESGQQIVQFRDVHIYRFDESGTLGEITHAGRAAHDGERWDLQNVSRMLFEHQAVNKSFEGDRPWDTRLEPELVDAAVNRPQHMAMRTLWKQMQYVNENGLDDRIYRSHLLAKGFFPATVLALILAGMPFVFGSARNQKLGVRLFIGMTLGITFTIVNRAMLNLGEAYGISALLTALGPSLLLAATAIIVLRRSA